MGERVEGSRVWRSSDPVTKEASDIDLKVEESDLNYSAFCFVSEILMARGLTAPTIQKLTAAINHISGYSKTGYQRRRCGMAAGTNPALREFRGRTAVE